MMHGLLSNQLRVTVPALCDSSLGLKEAKLALTDCFLATNWEAIIGSVLKTVFTVNHNVH